MLRLATPMFKDEPYAVVDQVCGYCGGIVWASLYDEPAVNCYDVYLWCTDCGRELIEEELVDEDRFDSDHPLTDGSPSDGLQL